MTTTIAPHPQITPTLGNDLAQWLANHRQQCTMEVREIAFADSAEWEFAGRVMSHKTGGFFSVIGARAWQSQSQRAVAEHPLIDQPEIGILGFAVRQRDGELDVLVQAKAEPGNVGLVQAAPTVQATESNFLRKHHGRQTRYLEWFRDAGETRVISDSLQSEQGTRFLAKYNRNMVVEVGSDGASSPPPQFGWFPLRSLLGLLDHDFQVNTDARSVLASSDWRALAPDGDPFARCRDRGGFYAELSRSFQCTAEPAESIVAHLNCLRNQSNLRVEVVGLNELRDWVVEERRVRCASRDSFEVRHFSVDSAQREVSQWDQPLMASNHPGEVVLLCQRDESGVLRFLFQARSEIGFREGIQLGPSVQMSIDDNQHTLGPPLDDSLIEVAARSETCMSCMHSDEGGRFYRCVSRYRVCMLPDDERIAAHERLVWLTLGQIEQLVKLQGVFTNEARSAVSMLLAHI